jgi:hypothetical protein
MEDQHDSPSSVVPENGRIQRVNVADEVVNASSEVVTPPRMLFLHASTMSSVSGLRHVTRYRRLARPHLQDRRRSTSTTVGLASASIFRERRRFGQISWEEWFENFDQHHCTFVCDNDRSMPLSNRYRIVRRISGRPPRSWK